MASRPAQDGSKSDQKVMHVLFRFLTRFGFVLGSFWDPFWEPKSTPDPDDLDLERLVFDLVIAWSQDGRQDSPKRAQEPPRAAQDPPKTLPRGPKTSQEQPETLPRRSKEGPRAPKSGIRSPSLQFSSRLGVRFVDSSHGFDQ